MGAVEIKASAENPKGKYIEELGSQVEPRDNSGLEIGISKSSALVVFEAVEGGVT